MLIKDRRTEANILPILLIPIVGYSNGGAEH